MLGLRPIPRRTLECILAAVTRSNPAADTRRGEGRRDPAAGPGQVLLHVGMHKTGTTAFQQYLAQWRAEILRDHGILVHPGCFMPSHLELPALVIRDELLIPDRWLLDGRRLQMCAAAMHRAIRATVESPAEIVLFSAEGLSYIRTQGEMDHLRDLLAPRMIKPIVAFRDKARYLASFRATLLRLGFSGPVDDPGAVAYTEPDSWLVDYPALLDVLRDLAGARCPVVLDYDREVASTESIIPALAEAVGLQRSALYPGWERRDNVTPRA